jgi:integrin-linked kinase
MNVNLFNLVGDTPLIIAVKRHNVEFVAKLLAAGANVNASNLHGNSPLHYACYWRSAEICRMLCAIEGVHILISIISASIMLIH